MIYLFKFPDEIKNKIQSYLYFSKNVSEKIININYFIKNYKIIYLNYYYDLFKENISVLIYRIFKYIYFYVYFDNIKQYNKYENVIYKPFEYSNVNNNPLFTNTVCSMKEQAEIIINNSSLLELKKMNSFILNPPNDVMH